MRILEAFGEPISNGGQESFVMNVVTHMNLSNKTVDLLTPYYCDNEHYKNQIESLGGNIFTFNKPFMPGKSRFNICDALDDFFKKNKYDVVHIHSGSISIFGIYAYYAKKNGVKKVIVHSHSSIEKKSLRNTILRYVCNVFLKNNVDVYCACSRIAGESKFVEAVVKNKLVIIKNGIDVEKFRFNEVTRKNLRDSLNIKDNEFVVGHVGRFSDEKNHTFLIDIFEQILKHRPNSKLMLIGSGELANNVKEKVSRLGLEDKVMFIGSVHNVYDYYQVMDCFVLPSKFEGLPLVGVEAQAAGLCCYFSSVVTKELGVTKLAHYISLNKSNEKWAEQICDCVKLTRVDMSLEIKEAGFSMDIEVRKIENLYL